MSTVAGLDVQAADQLAKTSGKALRKQLGLVDLVFACVLMVVIPDFFGTAVKAGSACVFFWLLALAFFFVPQAFIVSHLNQKLPLEGGLYEWARAAFGDMVGFLVAWNLWLYVVLYSAAVGLVTMNYLSYILGPNHAWMVTDRRALTCQRLKTPRRSSQAQTAVRCTDLVRPRCHLLRPSINLPTP